MATRSDSPKPPMTIAYTTSLFKMQNKMVSNPAQSDNIPWIPDIDWCASPQIIL